MFTLKNILITGGAGFIGSNVALKLIADGYNVRVLDNLSPQIHGENASLPEKLIGKVDFIHGSVCDSDSWIAALEGMDAVLHLAAETGTGQSMYEIERYCNVNVCGTAKLLDILTNRKHSIKKIVVASSRAIYGEGSYLCDVHGRVFPNERQAKQMMQGDFEVKCPICGKSVSCCATAEDAVIHPMSVYGITKQMQEEMIMTVCKALGISAVSLRYQNVYGPGQSLSNPYTGILSIFSTQIRNGNDINIFEDGLEGRDFVFIDDVANATVKALKQDVLYEAFNIGCGELITVQQVVNKLMQVYGKKVCVNISGDFRCGDIKNNFADITKARKLLGYVPEISFEKGIEIFADWVMKQKIENSKYVESLEEMESKGLLKSVNKR